MEITKSFCDICKKEIQHGIQKVALKGSVDMTSSVSALEQLYVCRHCGVQFFRLLKSMKDNYKDARVEWYTHND